MPCQCSELTMISSLPTQSRRKTVWMGPYLSSRGRPDRSRWSLPVNVVNGLMQATAKGDVQLLKAADHGIEDGAHDETFA
jgi:hypothetical protein